MQMAVSVKKDWWDPEFCYYGEMTSQVSSPLHYDLKIAIYKLGILAFQSGTKTW